MLAAGIAAHRPCWGYGVPREAAALPSLWAGLGLVVPSLPGRAGPSAGLVAAQLPFLLGRVPGSSTRVACRMGLCEQPVLFLAAPLITWETALLLYIAVLKPYTRG